MRRGVRFVCAGRARQEGKTDRENLADRSGCAEVAEDRVPIKHRVGESIAAEPEFSTSARLEFWQ